MATSDLLQNVIDRLENVKERGNEWDARCPAHEDRKNSLGVSVGKEGKILLCCQAGCKAESIVERLGLKMSDLFPKSDEKPVNPSISACYDYTDESGKILYQSVRYIPKDFRQRRPNGANGWQYNLQGVRRVLYRLPEVQAAIQSGETVFFVEGEKDADNLRKFGLCATCNAMGAKGWRAEYSEQLRGANVVILPDNDEPGQKLAAQVGAALLQTAKRVVSLELPSLPPKGDVSDWITAGGKKAQLLALAETAPLVTPARKSLSEKSTASNADLSGIKVNARQLEDIGNEALAALAEKNDPPRLFIRSGKLSRKQFDERGKLFIAEIGIDAIQGELAKASKWITATERGEAKDAFPPRPVCAYVLHSAQYPDAIPPLAGIVNAPAFAPDGSLQTETGYNPATRLYYHSTDPRPIPDTTPTPANVKAAKALLLDELMIDFPFEDEASKAHAMAFLFLPFVRSMIDGNTPLHLFEAPKSSSGKSLLCETLANVFCGNVSLQTAPPTDEEMGKTLLASLLSGESHVVFDNSRNLNFPKFHGAITSGEYKDRKMGLTENASPAQTVVWGATGNNLRTTDELTSRTVLIRIDPRLENPDERTGFKHPDLKKWAKENRPALIGAALTLCRAWIEAGKPAYTGAERIERFPAWAQVIGGILEHIGVPGLLGNRTKHKQASDSDGAAWRGLVGAWHETHREGEVTSAMLFDSGLPMEWMADKLRGEPASQKIQFGKMLQSQNGQVHNGLQITHVGEVRSGNAKGKKLYALRPPKIGVSGASGVSDSLTCSEKKNVEKNNTLHSNGEILAPLAPLTPFEAGIAVVAGEAIEEVEA